MHIHSMEQSSSAACFWNSIAMFENEPFYRGYPGFVGQVAVKNELFIIMPEYQLIQRFVYNANGNVSYFNRHKLKTQEYTMTIIQIVLHILY